jgi:hypothetical protein
MNIIYVCMGMSALSLLIMIAYHGKNMNDYFYKREHGLLKKHDPLYSFGFKNAYHI